MMALMHVCLGIVVVAGTVGLVIVVACLVRDCIRTFI